MCECDKLEWNLDDASRFFNECSLLLVVIWYRYFYHMWVNLEEYIILLSATYNYFTSPRNFLTCLSDYFADKRDIIWEKVKKNWTFWIFKKACQNGVFPDNLDFFAATLYPLKRRWGAPKCLLENERSEFHRVWRITPCDKIPLWP